MKKYINFIKESTSELSKEVRSLLNEMGDTSDIVMKVLDYIQKSPNLTDSKRYIDDFFTERMKMVDTVKNYESYQKILEDDLSSINVILNVLSKFGDRLKPEELYKESHNNYLKKIFSYTGTKFQGALSENVKLLLVDLGKQSGIELEDVEEKNGGEKSEKINESEEIQGQSVETNSEENVEGEGEKETTEDKETDTIEKEENLDKFKKVVEEFRFGACFKPLDMKLIEIIKERE